MQVQDTYSWFSIGCYYDDLEKLFVKKANNVLQTITNQEWCNQFFFSQAKERGEHLLLAFETTKEVFENKIKPLVQKELNQYFENNPAQPKKIEFPINDWFLPLPHNHIHINEKFQFDLMETGGLQASKVAIKLLSESAQIFSELAEDEEEWNGGVNLPLGLQFHVILLKTFLNKENLSTFSNYLFEEVLTQTIFDGSRSKEEQNLLKGLTDSFDQQKEGLLQFSEYLLTTDEYDDEVLTEWSNYIKVASKEMNDIQVSGYYVVPESFELSSYKNSDSILFPVLMYYIRAINTQMNVNGIYELNLLFIIKNVMQTLTKGE